MAYLLKTFFSNGQGTDKRTHGQTYGRTVRLYHKNTDSAKNRTCVNG